MSINRKIHFIYLIFVYNRCHSWHMIIPLRTCLKKHFSKFTGFWGLLRG